MRVAHPLGAARQVFGDDACGDVVAAAGQHLIAPVATTAARLYCVESCLSGVSCDE